MISRKIFLTSLIILSGCTVPVIKGDSELTKKLISFPKVGTITTTQVGNIAVLHTNYLSRHVYKLEKPFLKNVMLLSKITVSNDDELLKADINGDTLYCTQFNAYIEPITGPRAIACFKSTSPGKFSSVTYRPGAIWLSSDISPEIEFKSNEVQIKDKSLASKRELVYEGSNNGIISFSEKIYENSLTQPSRIKPVMVKIDSVPKKITINDLEINVINHNSNNIVFELIKPWQ